MIKANELRIGNYIYQLGYDINHDHKFLDGTKEVITVEIETFKFVNDDYGEFAPIPLSPEILEKCGFQKDASNDNEERNIWSIQVGNNHSLYYDPELKNYTDQWYISHEWNNNHFQNGFWNHPKYVHQLQNLYFALTGDELSVKL